MLSFLPSLDKKIAKIKMRKLIFVLIFFRLAIKVKSEDASQLQPQFYFQMDWALANDCDFFGVDINAILEVETESECRIKCNEVDICTHYTYDSIRKNCWIKSGRVHFDDASPTPPEKGFKCGLRCRKLKNRDCQNLEQMAVAGGEVTGEDLPKFYFQSPWALAVNCDLYGSDLAPHDNCASEKDCRSLCEAFTLCTHYTYVAQDLCCWLKVGRVSFRDASPTTPERGINCGLKCDKLKNRDCQNMQKPKEKTGIIKKKVFFNDYPAGFYRGENCFFDQKPYIKLYSLTVDECAAECRSKATCSHFNYLTGYCNLFNDLFDLETMKENQNNFAYCGFDCETLHAENVCMANKKLTKIGVEMINGRDPAPKMQLFNQKEDNRKHPAKKLINEKKSEGFFLARRQNNKVNIED